MKHILTLLLMVVATITTAQNPCKDSLYIQLKSKHLDSMTSRQYAYMMEKEKQCSEITKTKIEQEANIQNAQTMRNNSNGLTAVWIITLLLCLIIPFAII